MKPPTPAEIVEAREAVGLSQAKAAELVHVVTNAWKHWEAGRRTMPAHAWELFLIKTGQK